MRIAQRDLKRLHVEPVARQHAGVIAPLRVGRRPAAARVGHVDHVVMHQRRGVQHLHHGREPDRSLLAALPPSPAIRAQSSNNDGRSRLPPLLCR